MILNNYTGKLRNRAEGPLRDIQESENDASDVVSKEGNTTPGTLKKNHKWDLVLSVSILRLQSSWIHNLISGDIPQKIY